jgi:16S rRNA (cytosine967-C5)-methyltransferase
MAAPPSTARRLAGQVLHRIYHTQTFAGDAFDAAFKDTTLSDQDRALAFELVFGVLRHAITLDWRLDHISRKPMARLPLDVATTLRVAAYQLLHLNRIPASAAVNEAVKSVRTRSGHNWGGLVNAILRNLIRQPAPPFPDPATDQVGSLALRYACPAWMVERWIQSFGTAKAEAICQKTLETPPVTLRTNTLRCTRDELLTRLQTEGVLAHPTPVSPVGVTLERTGLPGRLPVVRDGWCYIEDEAAQLIPPILDPQPGHRILDVCAAPGGKTTHLAQLMGNQGTIVALDRQPDRLTRLIANCRRLGVSIVQTRQCDALTDLPGIEKRETTEPTSLAGILHEPFDRILVDTPCSGLGVLRRHPEGKIIKDPSSIEQNRGIQPHILDAVAHLLRPGGILVYSACSTETEETTEVIIDFCRRHPEFHQESLVSWIPDAGHVLLNQEGQLFTAWNSLKMDGFFACRLVKQTN